MKVMGEPGPLAARAREFYGSVVSGYSDSSEPVLWCGQREPPVGESHIWMRQHTGRGTCWEAADEAAKDRKRLSLVAVVLTDIPSGYAGRPQYAVVDGRGTQWLASESEVMNYLRVVVGEG